MSSSFARNFIMSGGGHMLIVLGKERINQSFIVVYSSEKVRSNCCTVLHMFRIWCKISFGWAVIMCGFKWN